MEKKSFQKNFFSFLKIQSIQLDFGGVVVQALASLSVIAPSFSAVTSAALELAIDKFCTHDLTSSSRSSLDLNTLACGYSDLSLSLNSFTTLASNFPIESFVNRVNDS